jgi:hypothetical protein
MKDETFQIPGINLRLNIAQTALVLMVATVLFLAFRYSMLLQSPMPAQLLVAICIGIFSSVVSLWILDAVSIGGQQIGLGSRYSPALDGSPLRELSTVFITLPTLYTPLTPRQLASANCSSKKEAPKNYHLRSKPRHSMVLSQHRSRHSAKS